jgi:4-hydroxy-3-methylbut-2-enyl diphosphate reductase IspH
LGDIVHNGQEVRRLEGLGLQTIDYDDLRALPPRSRVLFRAHGEPPSTYWIAQQRGIAVVDATCPVVTKLQERIRACYEAHKNDAPMPPQIVIYGKLGHAEVIGLQGQTNNTAVVIESADQLDRLDFSRPVYLFSQTTKSVEGFNALVEAILQRKRSYSASGLTAQQSNSEAVCEFVHVLSHRRLHARFFVHRVKQLPTLPGTFPVAWAELDGYALSRLTLRALDSVSP